jgi:hypothetical protein
MRYITGVPTMGHRVWNRSTAGTPRIGPHERGGIPPTAPAVPGAQAEPPDGGAGA